MRVLTRLLLAAMLLVLLLLPHTPHARCVNTNGDALDDTDGDCGQFLRRSATEAMLDGTGRG